MYFRPSNMAYKILNIVFILLAHILYIIGLDVSTGLGNLDLLEYERYNIMKILEGGKFLKGMNDPKSETGEFPVEISEVKPFYIDVFPVTNAQYLKFTQAKPKFKTDAELRGWSWVLRNFVNRTKGDADWIEVRYASWKKPIGPGSSYKDMLDYPAVHISYNDAKAFCEFYGKRLPDELEWEFAARGGLYGKSYPWGDRYQRGRANLWQGKFPDGNKKSDKWEGVSPVHAFPVQNDFGLYDMQGNVWEWTTTRYYERVIPRDLQELRYTVKGCSFVDSRDGDINSLVRVSQRMGLEPLYTSQNVGFRCAKSAKHYWKKPEPPVKKEIFTGKRSSGPRKHLRSEMADPDLAEKVREQIRKRKKKDEL